MSQLALTLSPSPLETPTSFLSRLAARNLSADIWAFCQDVGLDLAAISTGDTLAITQLCGLAGLPADTFDNRTIIKTSSMKYRLGTEVMNTETLSRGAIRFCPSCVSEALRVHGLLWRVVHELHWQFIHIRCCWKHGTRLESFKTKAGPSSRFDFTAVVREQAQSISSFPEATTIVDDLDVYLSERTYGEQAPQWCDILELPALIKACEAFGVLMDHGRDTRASSLQFEQRRDAMLTGFRILAAGPEGICHALDHYNSRTPTRGGNQPHPSNGEVHRLLGSHAKLRPDLDPVRDIVRDYFLDHYPFRAGSVVLGQKVTETRVFSLRGACREVGVRRSLLEEMLIRRGVASRDAAGAFDLTVPLTRMLIGELTKQKLEYLDQSGASVFLGCTFAMFKQLQRAGILRPDDGEKRRMRKGYRRDALQAFLERIGEGADRVSKQPQRLCTIDLATRKANCSVPDVVHLLLEGKIRATARLTNNVRLDSLLVNPSEVTRALSGAEPNGYSKTEVRRYLCVNASTLEYLITRRLIEVRRMRHSATRVTREYVTAASLEAFKVKFFTTGMYAREQNLTSQCARRSLREWGLKPITEKIGVRKIYCRRDALATGSFRDRHDLPCTE